MKPTDRSGSRGVMKIEALSELSVAVERARNESFTQQAIIEEYVSGVEVSVESISWQGEHYILAITDKVTTGEPYFVELEHHQPSMLSDDIQERIIKETLKALSALNIKYGASHSEFKITDDGQVYAIEVGARMGGDFIGSDLVKLSTGYDFVKAVIELALGMFVMPKIEQNKYSGIYFLSAETERLLSVFKNENNYNWLVEKSVINQKLNSVQSSADRSGFIIYQSDEKIIL